MSQEGAAQTTETSVADVTKQACQAVQEELNAAEEALIRPIVQTWTRMMDEADWKTLLPVCIKQGVKNLLVAIADRRDRSMLQAAMQRGVEHFNRVTGLQCDWVMAFPENPSMLEAFVYIILPTPAKTPNPSFHLHPYEEVAFFRQHGWTVDQSMTPKNHYCSIL